MGKKRASFASDEDLFQLLAKETGGEVLDDIDNIKFYVDTGNLALNYNCCGKFIGGGYPSGRIVEIYGPSSSSKSLLGANALFSTQRRDGIAAIIDAENAVNKEFLQRASHCELSKVLRYAPPSLEECFHKINVLIQSVKSQAEKLRERGDDDKAEELLNKSITIVYDSITVSPCKRELREVELPDNYTDADYKKIVRSKEQPGERAKICSKELRKLGPLLEGSNVTVIVLNQTRSKVGVLFGCFFYGSKVLLADGTWMKIGKIVNNKLPVEVMSLNVDTGLFEPKKVIGWHDNGNLSEGEHFLKIKFRRNFQNAFGHMMVTPNHKIFTKKHGNYKEVDAGTLKKGDKILCYQPSNESVLVDVVDISKYQPRIARKKFDLTIEDNSNYVVGGAVVHNSNETTGGGGLSLEFYASVRLRTQGQKKIQKKLLGDRKKTLGVNIKVQNVKNKINKPFAEADTIPLMFETGINPLGGLLSALYEAERIEATGRGNYQVKQPWGDTKFKASLDANTIPLEVLLECPTLVDAKDRKELEDYLAPFYDAINYKPPEDTFEVTPASEDEAMDMDEDVDQELMES